MIQNNEFILDEQTISKLGLRQSDEAINAEVALSSRVFEYPGLDKVYVMESDLYGNAMPKGSCFLAFYGQHGLIGKHIKVETLQNATKLAIKELVENNIES